MVTFVSGGDNEHVALASSRVRLTYGASQIDSQFLGRISRGLQRVHRPPHARYVPEISRATPSNGVSTPIPLYVKSPSNGHLSNYSALLVSNFPRANLRAATNKRGDKLLSALQRRKSIDISHRMMGESEFHGMHVFTISREGDENAFQRAYYPAHNE